MDKTELLNQIKQLASEKKVTLNELEHAYYEGTGAQKPQKFAYKVKISEILYYIGGAIVFLGIGILVFQNWGMLTTLTRIIITLGSGFVAYFVAVMLINEEKYMKLSYAFFFISALVIPIGLHVVFDSAGLSVTQSSTQSMISAILLFTYLLSYYIFRKNMFLVFGIFFGTWLFFALTQTIAGGTFHTQTFFEYRFLMTGVVYCLLGYSFLKSKKEILTGPLYAFGALFTLGAALSLGGWGGLGHNILWEILYVPLTFTFIFLSVHLKSKSFLSLGALFLIFFILKMTAEYFTSSLGWPIALVFAGFMVIAVGYTSVYINRRYLKRESQENHTSIV